MDSKQQTRDRATGRYTEDGNWDRLCRCGHTLGHHTGEAHQGKRPCITADFGGPDCDCEKFRAARRKG